MQSMFTYAQWKTAVSDAMLTSDAFANVIRQAKAFLEDPAPTRDQAASLRRALKFWMHQKPDWKVTVRNRRIPGHGPAIEALWNRMEYVLNGKAIDTLRVEAQKIVNTLSGQLDGFYRQMLDEIFVHPRIAGSNICWHQGTSGDQDFETNYKAIPGAAASYPVGGVKAFTVTLKEGKPHYPVLTDFQHQPVNRVMELRPSFADSTICHELFHWLTHEQYEVAAKPFAGQDNKNIIEGVTEFFTRKIRNDRGIGNYHDELDAVQYALMDGSFTEPQLAAAYFRGVNATWVMNQLRDSALAKKATTFYQVPQLKTIIGNHAATRWTPEVKAYVKRLTPQKMKALNLPAASIRNVEAYQKNPI